MYLPLQYCQDLIYYTLEILQYIINIFSFDSQLGFMKLNNRNI